jgi:replicative superfamily II helicase
MSSTSSNEPKEAFYRGTRRTSEPIRSASPSPAALMHRTLDDGILSDDSLHKWSQNGIAIHHAGLESGDRHLIEDWFRKGRLRMLVSTSVRQASHFFFDL